MKILVLWVWLMSSISFVNAQSGVFELYKTCLSETKRVMFEKTFAECSMIVGNSASACNVQASEIAFSSTFNQAVVAKCKRASGLESGVSGSVSNGTDEMPGIGEEAESVAVPAVRAIVKPVVQTAKAVPTPTARPADQDKQAVKQEEAKAEQEPSFNGPSASQVQADVASCVNLEAQAQRCCGSAEACLSASDRQKLARVNSMINADVGSIGVAEYCRQMDQLQADTGGLQLSVGSACTVNQSSCQSSCASLAQKYDGLVQECGDTCANASAYRNAASSLRSYASTCGGLQARATELSGRAVASGGSQAYARHCGGVNPAGTASISPLPALNSLGQNQDAYGGMPIAQGESPLSGSTTTGDVSGGGEQGQAGFGGYNSRRREGGFDLPPTSATSYSSDYGSGPNDYPTASASTIANNTGGPIPGAGANGSAAKLDPRRAASPGEPGVSTDIQQGFQQAPGASFNFQTAPQANQDAGRRDANGPRGGEGYLGMNLRDYLPGEKSDPNRRLAGMLNGLHIHGPSTNLFERVSTKLQERCKLGSLFDCH